MPVPDSGFWGPLFIVLYHTGGVRMCSFCAQISKQTSHRDW